MSSLQRVEGRLGLSGEVSGVIDEFGPEFDDPDAEEVLRTMPFLPNPLPRMRTPLSLVESAAIDVIGEQSATTTNLSDPEVMSTSQILDVPISHVKHLMAMGKALIETRRRLDQLRAPHSRAPTAYKTLLQFLENAERLSREQLSPIFPYFEEGVLSQRRFYHPKSIESSSGLRTFTCFAKLPHEIRLMIWRASLPGTRIFEVNVFTEIIDRPLDLKAIQRERLSILQVCRESYMIVLVNYENSVFYTQDDHLNCFRSPCLQDHFRDIFYFRNTTLYTMLPVCNRDYDPGCLDADLDTDLKHSLQSELEFDRTSRRYLESVQSLALDFTADTVRYILSSSRNTWTMEDMIPNRIHLLSNLKQLIFVGDADRLIKTPLTHNHYRQSFNLNKTGKILQLTLQEEDESHPFFQIWSKEIQNIREVMEIPTVAEAYKHIKVSFGILRRERL